MHGYYTTKKPIPIYVKELAQELNLNKQEYYKRSEIQSLVEERFLDGNILGPEVVGTLFKNGYRIRLTASDQSKPLLKKADQLYKLANQIETQYKIYIEDLLFDYYGQQND